MKKLLDPLLFFGFTHKICFPIAISSYETSPSIRCIQMMSHIMQPLQENNFKTSKGEEKLAEVF
jgi:hypothetical protein